MALRKKNWIDINAGSLLEDAEMDTLAGALHDMVLRTANGEYTTRSEIARYKEIGIFKNGVTL